MYLFTYADDRIQKKQVAFHMWIAGVVTPGKKNHGKGRIVPDIIWVD